MLDQPTATPPFPCMVCGQPGCFGFETARGVVWTCQAHQNAGKAVVVAPGPMARVAGGPGR